MNSTIPLGWQCDASDYLDDRYLFFPSIRNNLLFSCDCYCGALDPVCLFCDNPNPCDGHNRLPSVAVGIPNCDSICYYFVPIILANNLIYEELLIPGDFALRGYYGPTSLYAKTTTGLVVGQCPGDHLYDERPNMIYDGTVVCNAVASSQIYLTKLNIH